MKRLASLVLALALALTLAVPVMAAGNGTITVENPVENQTYVAYKIFDVTYSGDAHAYTIAADSEWYNAVSGYNGLEISAAVDGVCIVAKKSDYSAADFAAHLKNYLPADAESTTLTKTGETVKATGLDLGYYFVTSTTGSLCSLDTTNPNAVV